MSPHRDTTALPGAYLSALAWCRFAAALPCDPLTTQGGGIPYSTLPRQLTVARTALCADSPDARQSLAVPGGRYIAGTGISTYEPPRLDACDADGRGGELKFEHNRPVAQWKERASYTHFVAGSSPARPTRYAHHHRKPRS